MYKTAISVTLFLTKDPKVSEENFFLIEGNKVDE